MPWKGIFKIKSPSTLYQKIPSPLGNDNKCFIISSVFQYLIIRFQGLQCENYIDGVLLAFKNLTIIEPSNKISEFYTALPRKQSLLICDVFFY